MQQSELGFGIVGTLDLETVREIALRAEQLGIHSLWVNDTPGGDALARLEVVASVTDRLRLATGVIAVDRKPAAQIIDEVRQRSLPLERLTIGIGSAAPPSPLGRVRESVSVLRGELGVPVMVGSLGPKMRHLGATAANGLLFNWLTPELARSTTDEMRQAAASSGNTVAESGLYIRTALGIDALPVLEREAARYSAIPSYAANFERLGITAMETAVYAESGDDVVTGVGAFDGAVDHAIVRAITPTHDLEHYLRLLEAIAPLA